MLASKQFLSLDNCTEVTASAGISGTEYAHVSGGTVLGLQPPIIFLPCRSSFTHFPVRMSNILTVPSIDLGSRQKQRKQREGQNSFETDITTGIPNYLAIDESDKGTGHAAHDIRSHSSCITYPSSSRTDPQQNSHHQPKTPHAMSVIV